MKIYLLRHAEKDSHGVLTEDGKMAAKALGQKMPALKEVIASPSERAKLTAKLISGQEPTVDERAGFSMSTPAKSIAINALAEDKGIPFLDAVTLYNDREVLAGVEAKARGLNELLRELQGTADDNVAALVVSHDLSISPAMAQRGIPLGSVGFLRGYIILSDGSVSWFSPGNLGGHSG